MPVVRKEREREKERSREMDKETSTRGREKRGENPGRIECPKSLTYMFVPAEEVGLAAKPQHDGADHGRFARALKSPALGATQVGVGQME